MKFIFETMRFLLKHITLNQQITPTETFHTYFTTFQTAAPRRITGKALKIKQLDKNLIACFLLYTSDYSTVSHLL